MKKQTVLILVVAIGLLWAYPFYDSIQNDARSMGDLSRFSQALVWIGMAVFVYLMVPLFLWIWRRLTAWTKGE